MAKIIEVHELTASPTKGPIQISPIGKADQSTPATTTPKEGTSKISYDAFSPIKSTSPPPPSAPAPLDHVYFYFKVVHIF